MATTIYAPLFNQLVHQYEQTVASYHVPGHKYGRMLSLLDPAGPVPTYYSAIMQLDTTELSGTDDLHAPEGVIKEAQQLAAQCFGAEATYFLVGGSTAGNIAMILAACEPGDRIIVQRNSHKSVIHGLMLAGVEAIFLGPELDEAAAVPIIPSLATVAEALAQYPNAKAVHLTNPNYYGMGEGLQPYADLVHSYGLPLLIDEAHGAHFGHHPGLPPSAMQAGADVAVQSTHKTLSAMTMGAMLHMQGGRISRERMAEALAMVQSSSPSYPLMASLDIARAMIASQGASLFDPGMRAARIFRERMALANSAVRVAMEAGKPNSVSSASPSSNASGRYDDPMRVLLFDSTGRLSGYELLKRLELRGIWAEMADQQHAVLLFGAAATEAESEQLAAACAAIVHEGSCMSDAASGAAGAALVGTAGEAASMEASGGAIDSAPGCMVSHGAAVSLYASIIEERISQPVRLRRPSSAQQLAQPVPLEQAAGRIAAEMVIPYPPGIPVLLPGERISTAKQQLLLQLRAHKAKCQGVADPSLDSVLAISEKAE